MKTKSTGRGPRSHAAAAAASTEKNIPCVAKRGRPSSPGPRPAVATQAGPHATAVAAQISELSDQAFSHQRSRGQARKSHARRQAEDQSLRLGPPWMFAAPNKSPQERGAKRSVLCNLTARPGRPLA